MIRKPLIDLSTPKSKVFDIFLSCIFLSDGPSTKNVGRKNRKELYLRLSAYALRD
jgi:hypothetical protein